MCSSTTSIEVTLPSFINKGTNLETANWDFVAKYFPKFDDQVS
jgi:hypothetical protein